MIHDWPRTAARNHEQHFRKWKYNEYIQNEDKSNQFQSIEVSKTDQVKNSKSKSKSKSNAE